MAKYIIPLVTCRLISVLDGLLVIQQGQHLACVWKGIASFEVLNTEDLGLELTKAYPVPPLESGLGVLLSW
jgi:hypothetical protein